MTEDLPSASPRHAVLVEDAFRRGHDTRVGFEDSVLLPDGATADGNAQLVEAAVALRHRLGY